MVEHLPAAASARLAEAIAKFRRAGERFELVVGERRWRATRAAGLRTIPAVVKDVDEPQCGPGEVKLKVGACAICGTDVRIFFHGQKNVKPPAIVITSKSEKFFPSGKA